MKVLTLNEKKKVKKYKKSNFNELDVVMLASDYEEWKLFLYSAKVLGQEFSKRERFFVEVENASEDERIILSSRFMNHCFRWMKYYLDFANSYVGKLSFEDVLTFVECSLVEMTSRGISLDGRKYHRNIIDSQQSFLLSSLPRMFGVIASEGVGFSGRRSSSNHSDCKSLIVNMLQYASVFGKVMEVMRGSYEPKPSSFVEEKYGVQLGDKENKLLKFYLQKDPDNFSTLETYRDLNYIRAYSDESDMGVLTELMMDSGCIKSMSGEEFIHFDMSRSKELSDNLSLNNSKKLIESIYGSMESCFLYNGAEYKIMDLFDIFSSIERLATLLRRRNISGEFRSRKNLVYIKGEKSVLNDLGVDKSFSNLLRAFSLDVEGGNYSSMSCLPFLRKGGVYYMIPGFAVTLCAEKVVDKLLSSKEFKVMLRNSSQKGILFENRLLEIFRDSGYKCSSINRDERKKVPEIDAVVEFDDDNVLVIESKCSIKPEERSEVFGYIDNHLSKAVEQLVDRVDFIRERPDECDDRLPFSVKGKNVIPIVVSNHSFFSGLRIKISDDVAIYNIDETLLKKSINGVATCWNYNPDNNDYWFYDMELHESREKLSAIMNPLQFQVGIVRPTIQITDFGVAFEIAVQPEIDWEGAISAIGRGKG